MIPPLASFQEELAEHETIDDLLGMLRPMVDVTRVQVDGKEFEFGIDLGYTVPIERAEHIIWKDEVVDFIYVLANGKLILHSGLEVPESPDRITWLKDFMTTFSNISPKGMFNPHHLFSSLGTFETVNMLDIEGDALDIGCAEGLQTITAYNRGASRIISVERDSRWESYYQANMELNGVNSTFVNRKVPEKGMRIQGLQNVTTVVANLGPTYNIEFAPVYMLSQMPNARFYVGSGYVDGVNFRGTDLTARDSILAGKLKDYGFKPVHEIRIPFEVNDMPREYVTVLFERP